VAYILDRVGSSRGTAMGTFTGLQDLGVAIGPVIMGGVIQFTNYSGMFIILSLVGLMNLIYFYFSFKKINSFNCSLAKIYNLLPQA